MKTSEKVDKVQDKIQILAGSSGIVVEAQKVKAERHLAWRVFVISVCVIAGVSIFVVTAMFARQEQKLKETTDKLNQLQASLTSPDSLGDLNKLKQDSDSLIAGASQGTYQVSDKKLAQAYANRGDVEFNGANYKAAADDYKKAVELDGAQQNLVGYNEFVARYRLGERKELIPLLQTLQKPYKDNFAIGMQEHYEQYQSYIETLQAGKELDI